MRTTYYSINHWMFPLDIHPSIVFPTIYLSVCLSIYLSIYRCSVTPKSSIFIGFDMINHPFWGTAIYGNPHLRIWDTTEIKWEYQKLFVRSS